MKALIFAKRNFREILRDPLSWIFCIGFPIAMLLMFRIIDGDAATPMFALNSLAPGISLFSFAFVMLYMAILTSKDKTTTFLLRLFSSPMTVWDYLLGYAIPGVVIAFVQVVGCFFCSGLLAVFTGQSFDLLGYLAAIPVILPSSIFFIAMGIFFGSLFSDKAAPGVSSLIISMSGMLSGAWMPLDSMKTFSLICRFLPFYPAVRMGRAAVLLWDGSYGTFALDTATVAIYTILSVILAYAAFNHKMKADK